MQWFKRWRKKQRENNTLLFRLWVFFRDLRLTRAGQFEQRYRWHVAEPLAAFNKYGVGGGGVLPITKATYYETGVGDGISLLGLSLAGMQHVIGTDITALINSSSLGLLLNNYQKYAKRLNLSYPTLAGKLTNENVVAFLQNNLRIDYRAPASATHLDLPSNSVDYLGSFATLEHIPLTELTEVIAEHYRLLKVGGIFYLNIDYNDHIIYNENRKSYVRNRYAYLQYSIKTWHENEFWRQSDYFYQNRLRTKDYLALFQACGFRVLSVTPYDKTVNCRRDLAKIKVDPYFAKYTTDELLEQGGVFILTKD